MEFLERPNASVKSRSEYSIDFIGSQVIYGNSGHGYHVRGLSSSQRTYSEGHPIQLLGRYGADIGGPFLTLKLEVDFGTEPELIRHDYSPHDGWAYQNTVLMLPAEEMRSFLESDEPVKTDQQTKDFLLSWMTDIPEDLELSALGTKAIDLTSPVNPIVELADSLAELAGERAFFSIPTYDWSAGPMAGNYLNYVFGVKPTVSDFVQLHGAMRQADEILAQYRRDAGRNIRRQFKFDTDVDSTTSRKSGIYPVASLPGVVTPMVEPGTLTTTTTTTREFRFSGAFQYSIPSGLLPASVAELDRKYGIRPGMSTGWELVPFSWLLDWFSPINSILRNLDAYGNGLIMPYGYIMGTTKVVTRHDWTGGIKDSGGLMRQRHLSSTITRTAKKRLPASPFGFGVLPGDLSPGQLAILAALGLTSRR